MKHFIKTMVAASAMLAMLGCSKDWPFTPDEDGKVVIEGGGGEEPEGGIAYPATVYGTISWWRTDIMGYAYIYVYDANRTCICDHTHGLITHDPHPFNLCDCDMSTESPLPWYVCAHAYDDILDMWWHDEDTITNLTGSYTCPGGIIKKAPPGLGGVSLYLGTPGQCQSCD
jgi:hypothetical protein